MALNSFILGQLPHYDTSSGGHGAFHLLGVPSLQNALFAVDLDHKSWVQVLVQIPSGVIALVWDLSFYVYFFIYKSEKNSSFPIQLKVN